MLNSSSYVFSMYNTTFVQRFLLHSLTLHFLVIVVKYTKYQEVPEDEFSSWLSLLFEEHGLELLTTKQTEDIRQQFCICLVSSARNFEFLSFRA